MSTPIIKVGFIGLSASGWAAGALAPSLAQPSLHNKFKLVAVSTTSEKSATASAVHHGALFGNDVKPYYGPSAHIAADKGIDLIAVSVKAMSHKETILPVIEAGKNFFLEWPAGKSLEEAKEIAEATRKHGVKSMIGLQGRNSPTVKKVKEILASGVIGSVHSVTTITTFPRELQAWSPITNIGNTYVIDESNGVTGLSIAIGHELDSFSQIFGEFSTLSATAAQVYPTTTIVGADGVPIGEPVRVTAPDHYTIAGTLASGAVASIVWRLGYKGTPGRRSFLWEIDGEEGSIRLQVEDGNRSGLSQVNPTLYLNGEVVEVEGAERHLIGTLTAAWEAYSEGREDQYANIEDAVRNHERLEAIKTSLEEGRAVVLNQFLSEH